jgi:predicted phage-related endonuclease
MTGTVHMMEQGTEEWKAIRRGFATTSHFQEIIAKNRNGEEAASRKNYRIQVVLERLTGKTPSRFIQTESMAWGSDTEALARVEFELRTGRNVQQVGFIEHLFLKTGYSPDGLVGEDETLEIKCFNSANHKEMLETGKLPTDYKAQAMGGLWISDRSICNFESFDPDFPPNAQYVCVRVERDQRYIDDLAVEISRFLEEVDASETFIKNYKEVSHV